MKTYDIVFYVNLGLVILTLANAAAVCVLCKKTAFGIQTGLTSVFIAGFAVAAYIIQLVMYSLGNGYAEYAVYAALFLLCCGLIATCIYCFLLSKRSDGNLCIASGVLMFVPPVGTCLLAALSARLRRDSRAQNMLFNGYAYTFAAVGAFTARYGGGFIDSAEGVSFDELKERDAFKYVKTLKKKAKDADGVYKYAEALAHYFPQDTGLAARAMTKAAKSGHAAATFNLGYWHEIGYYFKKDLKKANELYARAEELGDSDAQLRRGVVAVERGNAQEGAQIFKTLADGGNDCALFDYALCAERGVGVEKDTVKAAELYADCARRGLFAAQQRLFALAGKSVGTVEYDDVFRKIASFQFFEGEFSLALEGMIAVKEKRAANAADAFLASIKYRGKWEGVARLFVGTLYIDSGETEYDRKNGAAYIKTAIPLTPLARDIYLIVPVSLRGKKDGKNKTGKTASAGDKASDPKLRPLKNETNTGAEKSS